MWARAPRQVQKSLGSGSRDGGGYAKFHTVHRPSWCCLAAGGSRDSRSRRASRGPRAFLVQFFRGRKNPKQCKNLLEDQLAGLGNKRLWDKCANKKCAGFSVLSHAPRPEKQHCYPSNAEAAVVLSPPLFLPRTTSGILALVPSKFVGILFRKCLVP